MTDPNIRAKQDRVVKALIGPKGTDQTQYVSSFGAKLSNLGSTTQRILDNSRWASGTAVYQLSALKINHQTEEIEDPRTCLTSGISNHPHIVGDGHEYRASMPSGAPIPEECLTCAMSALLTLSGGIKEVTVKTDFL